MVDAGFNDLIRPAMYGSYHRMSIVGAGTGREPEPFVVAGPLCESGDVFTRDEHELLQPRDLPRPGKFRYDRLYQRRAGFCRDLRLIAQSFWITARGRWEHRGRKV